MFYEDLQHQTQTPIISLDLLHLCRKGLQTLADEKSKGVGEVLGIMGSSPLLLYRFLEWQQEQGEALNRFNLTQFILFQVPEKYILPQVKNLSLLFKGQLNTIALIKSHRDLVLAQLPEAFSSRFDPRQYKRAGFIPFPSRLAQLLDLALNEVAAQKGTLQLSDQKDDLSKENLRKLRRLLEEPVNKVFDEILIRIERQAQQILGLRGMKMFLEQVISRVSFLSLLGLARGSRGDHLYLLNLHASVCSQLAQRLGQKLHGQRPRTVKGLPSPEDLFVMALIHDLGQAHLLTYFPEIHADIWEALIEQEHRRQRGEGEKLKSYPCIEQEILIQHRTERLYKLLKQLPKTKLSLLHEHLQNDCPYTLVDSNFDGALQTFVKHYLATLPDDPHHLWALGLWNHLELPATTPIPNSCDLASHLLTQSSRGQEFVRGAYENFSRFVKAYGNNEKEKSSTSVLFIRYINQLSLDFAEQCHYAIPCVYANIGASENFDQIQTLADRLDYSPHELQLLAQQSIDELLKEWQSLHPLQRQRKTAMNPLLHPQQLQNELQLQISDFFKTSEFFYAGVLRFNLLSHHVMTVINNAAELTPMRFVAEMEQGLRHFFRIMEVVIKPRTGHRQHKTPEEHFAVLFQNADFGDELTCFHYRHLIADFYLLDPQEQRVRHGEIEIFMRLFCDYLLLNYSSEIWELFKEEQEVARLDIARQIVLTHRLGDGLASQLLYLKARLLDGLPHRFSSECEPQRIVQLQFAIFKRDRPCPLEIFPTADFDYWSGQCEQNGEKAPDYVALSQELATQLNAKANEMQQIFSHGGDVSPFEFTIPHSGEPTSVLCLSLFELDERHLSRFMLLLIGATLKKDGPLMEALIDKGIPQKLARHQIQAEKNAGLALMTFFASDDSTSALSRLTHLRPSRLKEMGLLIQQVQREVRPLLPRLPQGMQDRLHTVIEEAKIFWDAHHQELRQGPKLSREGHLAFDALRQKTDHFKKSLRMTLADFCELLQNCPRGSLGKLRLADPLICCPWGLETLYLSHNAFGKFRDSVERKIQHGHPQLRTAAELLYRLESAWFISDTQHLKNSLVAYFEELSKESFVLNAIGPVSCSLTLFLYDEKIPHFPESPFPYLVLECFVACPTKEGGHQRMVGAAGGGYNCIFRDDFQEFCALAHRNVLQQKNGFLMECFFRRNDESPSLRYVEPHMEKNRFYGKTGVSTLFFFPCRSQNREHQQHHGF